MSTADCYEREEQHTDLSRERLVANEAYGLIGAKDVERASTDSNYCVARGSPSTEEYLPLEPFME